MMTKQNQIKCDVCGKFIGISELNDGRASHQLIMPDSEYSTEEFESFCIKHNTHPPAPEKMT